MKHSIYIVLISGLLATTMSCDNAINKAPIDQLSPEKLFVDEANAETAVRGVYRSLESAAYYGNAFVVIPEFAAGHMRHYLNFPEFVEYRENRIRVDNVMYGPVQNRYLFPIPQIERDLNSSLSQNAAYL